LTVWLTALHKLVSRQYTLLQRTTDAGLQAQGIRIMSHGERNAAQRAWVKQYFEKEVRPLLMPVGLDPSRPSP